MSETADAGKSLVNRPEAGGTVDDGTTICGWILVAGTGNRTASRNRSDRIAPSLAAAAVQSIRAAACE